MRHSHSSPSLSRRSSSHECKPLHSCPNYNIRHLSSAPFLLIFAKKRQYARNVCLLSIMNYCFFLRYAAAAAAPAASIRANIAFVMFIAAVFVDSSAFVLLLTSTSSSTDACRSLTMSSTSSCVISGSLVRFSARASSWMRACAHSVV